VAVAGYTNGSPVTYFYLVAAEGVPVRVSLEAPDRVYVNKPFTVKVHLEDYNGNPLTGETVIVADVEPSGLRELTALTTGEDGNATGEVVLTSRGVHRLVAYFPGRGLLMTGYSRQVEVTALEKVAAHLSLSPNVTVEGIPSTLLANLTDAYTGSPVAGVWVSVEANTTYGWASVGAGLTNSAGFTSVAISLPEGVYMLRLKLATPYLELAGQAEALLRVLPPGTPPPQGPYVSPIGRILAFPPVMAEAGEEAVVYFAFYYGENPAAPSSVSVRVVPETHATVEEVQPGVYRVTFTPEATGLYTVVMTATYNYATYVGVATFHVYDVEARLSSWGARVEELVASMEDANKTIYSLLAGLEALNESVTGFLEGLNSSVLEILSSINATVNEQLNYTIVTYLDSMNRSMTLYLRGINDTISHYLGSLLEALQAANMTKVYMLLLGLNRSQGVILADLGELNETMASGLSAVNAALEDTSAVVLENWEMLRGLNSTVYRLASQLNTSLSRIRVMIASNGHLIVEVNTSLSNLIANANASLSGLVKASEGRLYALITSKAGLILADLHSIGYNISIVRANVSEALSLLRDQEDQANTILSTLNDTVLEIRTSLGSLNVTLGDALRKLGLIQGILVTINGSTAEILDSTGSIKTVLLEDLKPGILDVKDGMALLNTSMGIVVADLGALKNYTTTLLGVHAKINATATSISEKLDKIMEKLDALNQQLQSQQGITTKAEKAYEKASRAYVAGVAGAGIGIAGLAAAVIALLRRP
jgi:hypothetical protein